MKNHYLKPLTIVIFLASLLPVFFSSCKDEAEEEMSIPPYVDWYPVPFNNVILEKGLVIQTEDGACILSDSDNLWKHLPGFDSLKSLVYPKSFYFDSSDLSNVGKKLEFTGTLLMYTRFAKDSKDTIMIEGKQQVVVKCTLHDYELIFTEGNKAEK